MKLRSDVPALAGEVRLVLPGLVSVWCAAAGAASDDMAEGQGFEVASIKAYNVHKYLYLLANIV